MNPTKSTPWIDEESSLPIARIDAQEEEYVIPLREYLEANGCHVVINETVNNPVAYHIVTGDIQFVKLIFSSIQKLNTTTLGIVLGSIDDTAQNDLKRFGKIVVADPVHLTGNDVIEIFSFFFAGNGAMLDKRRNRHEPAPSVTPPESGYAAALLHIREGETSESPLDTKLLNDEDSTRIGSIISDVFHDDKQTLQEQKMIKVKRGRRKKLRTSFWAIMGFIFLVFIFPLLLYGLSFVITSASFVAGERELKNSDINGARQIIGVGQYWLHQAKFSFAIVSVPLRLLGLNQTIRGQERILSFFSDISLAFQDTFVIASNSTTVARQMLASDGNSSNESPAHAIDQLRLHVVSVSETLGLAQAELTTLIRDKTFPLSISMLNKNAQQMQSTLETFRSNLTYVNELLTLYPSLSGFKGPETYLVLLQNSNELRPTGGFIGSVGVLTFENGIVSDFTIQDVYALDGQLKGHVDPPQPFRDLLGVEHWYLRDSNWSPDYKESAIRALWFYEKETGVHVDGVIALNVPVIVDLLSVTGPIVLSDYKDQISAENFFGKSFYYTQNDFFPGSTQKSDFLGALSRALLEKITQEKNVNALGIFQAITAGLSRKDILFMFDDSDVQQLVEHYGWGGRINAESACAGVDRAFCFFDPIFIVDANLSVSKVNYFIKRSAIREIILSPDGTITESVALTIRNTADVLNGKDTRGVGGAYVSYLRFFVSPDTLVDDVTLDGQSIHAKGDTKKTKPVLPYIETAEAVSGMNAIGVAVEVPAGEARIIKIALKRKNPLPFGRGGAVLDLFFYKQPGVSDQQLQTVIRYPLYWSVTDESKSPQQETGLETQTFLAKDGQLKYNSTILRDQIIRLRIIK